VSENVVLIAFIGKQYRKDGGYRFANYLFKDKTVIKTRYCAEALRKQYAPDRVVLLGTSGSMWDVLIEDCDAELLNEETRIQLMDAVDHQKVDQNILNQVSEAVASAWNCEVKLSLIPYGRTEHEQMTILRTMAEGAADANLVHLDITHGFRSLPMLALMAALYLEEVMELKIAGIHYGMLEDSDSEGNVPVVALDALLHFGHWIKALQQYRKDGDYSVFGELLERAGVKQTKQLMEAAFFERIGDARRAKEKISSFHGKMNPIDQKRFPAAAMFEDTLKERLNWFRKPGLAEQEWSLAEEYLERGDFMRAALLSVEAAVSSQVERTGENVSNFDSRQAAHDELYNNNEDFKQLNSLRNRLAHGSRDLSKGMKRALQDSQTLDSTLKSLIKGLRED